MNRTDRLIGEMTLREKLGQLTMTSAGYAVTGPVIAGDSTQAIRDGSIGNLLNLVGPGPVRDMQRLAVEESRLGIPLLFAFDVIHGHRTMFPIPIAEAGAFDAQLWRATAREAAREAAADGIAMAFAPMLDVSRDPRWGRTAEGPGEDGALSCRIAVAKVEGFQTANLAGPDAVAAVAKHFVAYGPVTAGREYAAVDISERAVHEVHLPAFLAAVKAGVASVMPAFTDLAGIPMTVHRGLIEGWLRRVAGFDGVVVSDYNAVAELISHGVAADLPEAAALALLAGVDIDMMADGFRRGLPLALERGLVSIEPIDRAVRRVLALKERLGLFDDPYARGATAESTAALADRRRLARRAAARSLVLLENREAALPLAETLASIALIGPLADAAGEMRGPWWAAAEPEGHVTVLAGLRAAWPQARISHAEGVPIEGGDDAGIAAAVALCDEADAILLCLGEGATMSGEAASRADPVLPGRQQALADAVLDRAATLGKRVVVILFSGRPLVVPALAERADALVAAWFLGSEAGAALAEVLSGRVSPSARLAMSWPRAVGQIPVFFGERPTGRRFERGNKYTTQFLDVDNSPLYPFGHGLSYGRFAYGDVRVSPQEVGEGGLLTVLVRLANEGDATAEETVFLFTRDVVASATQPLLVLRDFAKITLGPGEEGEVRFMLRAAELSILGQDLRPVFEPGDVEVLVGPSADRDRLTAQTIRLV